MLKQVRLRANLKAAEIVRHVRETEPRYDRYIHSRIENGIANPTPPVARIIAELVATSQNELFDLDYGKTYAKGTNTLKTPKNTVYKLTARIPIELTAGSDLKSMVKGCGYGTINTWIAQCYKRLQCEYAARQKNRPDTGMSKRANQIIPPQE